MRVLSLVPVFLAFGVKSTLSATLDFQRRSVVHEKRVINPVSWKVHKELDKGTTLPFRIGLKQNNIANLEDYLMEVSHPDSPNYGQHWTPEKVIETFKPSFETVDTVTKWLKEAGISVERIKLAKSQGWVEMKLTIEEAEELLDAKYFMYEHVNGHKHIGCESYSLPAHVQPHIDIILPTVHFDVPKQHLTNPDSNLQRRSVTKGAGLSAHLATAGQLARGSSNASSLANCDTEITPACIRALYKFDDPLLLSTKKNSFAIVEYTPNAFVQSDLDMFFRNFSPSLVGTSPTLVSIDGAKKGVDQMQEQGFKFNGESNLDLEHAMTLIAPQKVTLYQVGDTVEGASFNNMLDAIDASFCTFEGGDSPIFDGIYPDTLPGGFTGPESCGIIKPANVISTSYGFTEVMATPEYEIRQCNEYGKLGLMGVTFLYSSGDTGVGGLDEVCIDPVTGLELSNGTKFDPGFPATCPFVTVVGATQVNPGSTIHDPESACDTVIFSGGGFSNVFGLPSYQESAVTSFLKKHPPPYTAEQFNNSGKVRGYPDVSSNGSKHVVAVDGEFVLVFGTSLAAPVFASMITAINDARLTIGKKPVGFINPAASLYSSLFSFALNDITSGNNPGCGTSGFNATTGWDPVTGLGTPNFETLKALWLVLP
ncbi:hypothetical protein Clacol_002350 [Clathrus columnatus]|uniref:tripeptidyl-peptidase II n=1 Tax=Clathrus columnatus TaxID=1419009 RepID=A0AAV5A3X6_9AGAM|nr:hypothetical protein Clacol_002350 [Clathrus columnatus]